MLPRNVVVFGIVSLLADVSSDMVVPLLPAFVVTLGGGAAYIGVIEGAAEGTAALLKYVSGRWADRARRLLPLAVVGYALAASVRPFLAVAQAPWQVLAVRNVDRIGKGIRTSPRDKLLAASAPRHRLAEAFAFQRGMDHAGAAIGPLLAAAFLVIWPEQIRRVFLLAAIPGMLAVFALLGVREPASAPERREQEGDAPGRVPGRLLTAIGVFTVGNSTDALLLLRAETVGVPTVQLPLLWAALHVVRALASWPLGRVADRLGRERTLIVGWLWYAACYAGFALARGPAHVWILFAAYGLVAAMTEGTERAMVAAAVPPRARGRALGLYNLVTGAGLVAASILAGEIWEHASPAAALLFGAFLAFAASVVLHFGARAGERAPVA